MEESLTPEQQGHLSMFQEVTANARETPSAVQLLQACNWNVEQALQLHWATGDDASSAAASSSIAGRELGTPLLQQPGPADAGGQQPAPKRGLVSSVVGWFARGLQRVGVSVIRIVFTFIFGNAGSLINPGEASGALLSRALTESYGSVTELPRFFEGSFSQALQQARRDAQLVVVYLHSDHSRYTRKFCTEVLGNEFIRTMLNENFLLWGGDTARMESTRVAQMVHARGYPWFCVLLPASVDEIRIIGARHGDVEVDSVVALLTECLEDLETFRAEIIARREQQAEDRSLREEQDREYEQALEMDRKRKEQEDAQAAEQREAERKLEEERRLEQEQAQKLEEQRLALAEKRKRCAASLEAPGPDAKARVSMRLPTGQRVERKFLPTALLADVYAWADCVAYLPENEGKQLEIPERFTLKTSFPSKVLSEKEKTIEELQMGGTMILLAALEDDD